MLLTFCDSQLLSSELQAKTSYAWIDTSMV